jgi:PEP-CTERM/exosortase A-associated glycosyltransferase
VAARIDEPGRQDDEPTAAPGLPELRAGGLAPPGRLKILHILDHSIPMQSGYTFRTLGILREQQRRGWQTFQLTTPRHTAPGPDPESVDGLSFHRTASRSSSRPVLRELGEMRATARRLTELATRLQPDILHAHSPVLNALPALLVGRRLGIPVVYEVRAFWEDAAVTNAGSAEGGVKYRLSRAIEGFALRRADAVTTICAGLQGDMIARGLKPAKITVIPNAIDPDAFDAALPKDPELVRKYGLDDGIVLGFIGSFYGYEGLELLVRAVPALHRHHPDARLLLVGGGPEDQRLRALVQELGLADIVRFTGRVPHDQVDRHYSLVDIFVYPRLKMRLTDLVTPLKPLESMAMRRIVVASDVGGHRELVTPETGYLFAADDEDSLVAVLSRAIAERARWPEVAERALRFVRGERSWAHVVAGYEQVYGQVLSAARRRTV